MRSGVGGIKGGQAGIVFQSNKLKNTTYFKDYQIKALSLFLIIIL